jgi:hypothetical protein
MFRSVRTTIRPYRTFRLNMRFNGIPLELLVAIVLGKVW